MFVKAVGEKHIQELQLKLTPHKLLDTGLSFLSRNGFL